jgi:hypothetical protein
MSEEKPLMIVDLINQEIQFAKGIEAALAGVEIDDRTAGGVRWLQIVHIERLEAIAHRIEQERQAKR